MFIYFDDLQMRTKKYPCSLSTFLTMASNSERGQSNFETTNVLGIKKELIAPCCKFAVNPYSMSKP